ncbi:MAG: PrsW family intramembrane metalloprotease [Candidatus Vogelbacteria bacterium]|nr:PrsW family intramembrane metalloprotease [Candidatus Vogelbacteria bacterium]
MAQLVSPTMLFFSLIGGIIPAVLWLWFWLREDDKHPEPEALIVVTFICGVLSIVPTYFAEEAVTKTVTNPTLVLAVWALIEEVMKFAAAYIGGLRTRFYDEPIDAIIYLVTAALGFAAAENFLFIVNSQDVISSVLTGSMRFVGASLLHTLASAFIGSLMALAFNRERFTKLIAIIFGILTSTILHTSFNVFIIKNDGGNISVVFIALWLSIIFLILFFEKLRVEDIYNKPNIIN